MLSSECVPSTSIWHSIWSVCFVQLDRCHPDSAACLASIVRHCSDHPPPRSSGAARTAPPLSRYPFWSLSSISDAQLSPSLPPFWWSCRSSPFPTRHSHTVATVTPTAAAVAAATAAIFPTAGKPAASPPWHHGYCGSCGQRGAATDAAGVTSAVGGGIGGTGRKRQVGDIAAAGGGSGSGGIQRR